MPPLTLWSRPVPPLSFVVNDPWDSGHNCLMLDTFHLSKSNFCSGTSAGAEDSQSQARSGDQESQAGLDHHKSETEEQERPQNSEAPGRWAIFGIMIVTTPLRFWGVQDTVVPKFMNCNTESPTFEMSHPPVMQRVKASPQKHKNQAEDFCGHGPPPPSPGQGFAIELCLPFFHFILGCFLFSEAHQIPLRQKKP